MLEQELASIVNAIHKINTVDYYLYELDEGYQVPCMFFPVPAVTTRPFTTTTYVFVYTWPIKIFDYTDETSFEAAMTILEGINNRRGVIEILDEYGVGTGKYLRIGNSSIRKADVGGVQLDLKWTSQYKYTQGTFVRINKFVFIKEISKDT